MPNLPITGLPAAGALDGTEAVPVEKAGTTVQTTTQAIADLGGGGGSNAIARGQIGSTGTIVGPSAGIDDVTYDCGQPGIYQVEFTTDFFGSAPACVATAVFNGPPKICHIDPDEVSGTHCVVIVTDEAGTPADCNFHFIAIGVPGPPL